MSIKKQLMDEEEEEGGSISSFYMKKYWFIIVLAAFVWIIYRGHKGTVTFDTVDYYFAIFIIGFWFLDSINMTWKEKTGKIISNPVYSTVKIGSWRTVGNWMLIRLGAIDAAGVSMKGRDGTMIIPIQSVEVRGPSLNVKADVDKVTLDCLPHIIVDVIQKENFPAPYYFGFASQAAYRDIPELSHFFEEMKNANRRVNSLESQNKEILRHAEIMISKMGSMEEYRTKGAFQRFIDSYNKLKNRKDEEGD